jgi:ADP-ribose pyrophosphatase
MEEWELQKEVLSYDGKYRQIITRTFRLPTGFVGDYQITTSHITTGAAVFALTDDNHVVVFRQYRPGPMKTLYELPGGGVEDGEDVQAAVARELLEETGYEAELEQIGSFYRDAYTTGHTHMFIGRHAKKVAETAHEISEYGDVLLLTVDEFKEKLFAGELTDLGLGYAGLLKFGLL